MIPFAETAMPDAALAAALLLVLLAPLALLGLVLINVGLGRARSAAFTAAASLLAFACAAIVYWLWGFSLAGFPGGDSHSLLIRGVGWDWLARLPAGFSSFLFDASRVSVFATLQLFVVGFAALIPLGAALERWRLRACCLSTVLLAGVTFPLFAHWAWAGWLAQLGANYHLGHGFIDVGGSGTVHAVGGLTALALAWILGPRRGKYGTEGMPAALPGHNVTYVLAGCWLALAGFIALNCALALVLFSLALSQMFLVAVNVTLAAGAGALSSAAVSRVQFGKPDASLAANGWVCGLVAISAGAPFFGPAAAIVTGAIAGVLVTFAVQMLELRLRIDDPTGAVSVHALGGIWGLLALGLYANSHTALVNPMLRASPVRGLLFGDGGQFLAQWVGIATLLGAVLPLSYGLNAALQRWVRQRVTVEGERQGMDLHELGAGAYPEFVIHSDEFTK